MAHDWRRGFQSGGPGDKTTSHVPIRAVTLLKNNFIINSSVHNFFLFPLGRRAGDEVLKVGGRNTSHVPVI